MAAFSSFRPAVAIRATGAPIPLIDHELLHAARRFCRESESWEVEGVAIATLGGLADYDIPTVTDGKVLKVAKVLLAGLPLTVTTEDDLDVEDPTWRTRTGTTRFYLVDLAALKVRLFPIPVADSGDLVVIAACEPTLTAQTLPDYLLNDWQETIAAGAYARLGAIPGKSWTNADIVAEGWEMFKDGVAQATAKRIREAGATRLRARAAP